MLTQAVWTLRAVILAVLASVGVGAIAPAAVQTRAVVDRTRGVLRVEYSMPLADTYRLEEIDRLYVAAVRSGIGRSFATSREICVVIHLRDGHGYCVGTNRSAVVVARELAEQLGFIPDPDNGSATFRRP